MQLTFEQLEKKARNYKALSLLLTLILVAIFIVGAGPLLYVLRETAMFCAMGQIEGIFNTTLSHLGK